MPANGETRARANSTERLDDELRQHRDLVIGHDHVHPDRSDCGGVGSCIMMRAELDQERDIIDLLERIYRYGWRVTVSIHRV